MAWDPTTQHGGSFPGGVIEWGEATLANGTVEVPTQLSKIEAAFGFFKEDPGAAEAFYCDLTITSGCVTFACGNLAKTFLYALIGQG